MFDYVIRLRFFNRPIPAPTGGNNLTDTAHQQLVTGPLAEVAQKFGGTFSELKVKPGLQRFDVELDIPGMFSPMENSAMASGAKFEDVVAEISNQMGVNDYAQELGATVSYGAAWIKKQS